MMSNCPVAARASRNARSLASLPELTKADRQRLRQSGAEPPRIRENAVMEIACVGVEHRHLPLTCRHHMGVTMAYVGYIVDTVQIGAAVFIVEINPKAAHDLERLTVGDAQVGADARLALCQCQLLCRRRWREDRGRNPQEQVRIGCEAAIKCCLAGAATPGKSHPNSSGSTRSCKWRCGGQSPFAGGTPIFPNCGRPGLAHPPPAQPVTSDSGGHTRCKRADLSPWCDAAR